MGLGIIEPAGGRHVPGTSQLFDSTDGSDAAANAHLKHGSGKDTTLVLVPQPSASPNDPLVHRPTPRGTPPNIPY